MTYRTDQISVLADDYPVTRPGVVRTLTSSGRVEVSDGRMVLPAIRELQPVVAFSTTRA
ncbi:hypothetical protein JK2ML_0796 [Mycobacterium leprae Kyoto-2]|uniref:Uncharacterized protein n=3 Tax=Mycobacterium leprae TaxID=1769 RepID=Q7AQF5_MYCLE|nr:hypothetical protein [Mycobacterium leprae]pir/E87008/ hypothetical protein [imported] - Mycobacterium leprae [Mycobacterium leprae]CAR70890.1 hypothetical protein MLBr00796 [Mycobacterium leprae Br4923]AWV47582.1 hypothetical protein DIJ64_04315 [Mycobacterium leprae]OAR21793.1 hypothetical protein A8144_00985 [Mycobacterium leprae 3125609]OAX72335.1 hypothetical protein A3216_01065 [Mycobacterium leprae 7935681]CAC30305.1 hypothetical protein [Mycobacterium leprae]